MRYSLPILILYSIILLSGCKSYKQNILFKTDESTSISEKLISTNENKIIEIGDYLEMEVFTKYGEKIIDPDDQLTNATTDKLRPKLKYLVRSDGSTKLPMVGDVNVHNLTLNEAESLLENEFEKFYNDAFVKLNFLNKRVIVLGSPGGKIIPLENENTTLAEVIAIAEGIDNFGKGHNIRVLRGDQVFIADLTTIEGYRSSNVIIEPGDIIYVEPVRRPFTEFIRDNGPVISIFTSLLSLVVVIISIN